MVKLTREDKKKFKLEVKEMSIGNKTALSIDNYILELMQELNSKGYKTIYSCSAMKCDHNNRIDKSPSCIGYFTVISSKIKIKELTSMVTKIGFKVELEFTFNPFKKHIGIYQNQSFITLGNYGTDNEIGEVWDKLLYEFKKIQ